MKKRLPLLLLALLVSSVMKAQQPDSLKLVWHDEFDYTGAPDSTRWQYEYGFVRNHELQW